MHSPQWLAADETLQRFNAQRKLPRCQRTLRTNAARTQPIQMLRRRVLRAVDDAQVLAPAALDCRLYETAARAHDEVEGFDHHPFAAALCQRQPPRDRLGLALWIGDVHDTMLCRDDHLARRARF